MCLEGHQPTMGGGGHQPSMGRGYLPGFVPAPVGGVPAEGQNATECVL